ncbi:MAG TPA: fumarylacetoacetase [Bacteroidales bacterium]|nr:fumarylacetoacetase [Bacteroidales bacterium]
MKPSGDPILKSWLSADRGTDFPIQNLPFGIFRPKNRMNPRAGTRIGSTVIDLSVIAGKGYFADAGIADERIFSKPYLNDFIALGKSVRMNVRNKLTEIFNQENEEIWNTEDFYENLLFKSHEVEMLMPVKPSDYACFVSNAEYEAQVRTLFSAPDHKILSGWRTFPAGYHCRASSIVVSGTGIPRPYGQILDESGKSIEFGPSRQLDFKPAIGIITGKSTALGDRIPVSQAEDFIFGFVMLNNLAARDIQKLESVPFGNFLSGNFGTVMSPWIIMPDALEPFRVKGPGQVPEPMSYLQYSGKGNYDLTLEVFIQPENESSQQVCSSGIKNMYWNIFQQLAHFTVTGCSINTGDVFSSGTIGDTENNSGGLMPEPAHGRANSMRPSDKSIKHFINDGETVIIKAFAENDEIRIGFGECKTKILPAVPF